VKYLWIGLIAVFPVHAQLSASATVSSSVVNATTNHYDIVLKNTGTTTVGTFWFSWVPGYDFMPVAPSNLKAPAGWTANINHVGASDGYSVLWTASSSSAYLAAGQTLSGFSFDSTATPAQIMGYFPSYPGNALETSFVYIGAPLGDFGYQFIANNGAATPVLNASATVTSSVLSASTYHYDVVLKNAGTSTVGTFWFAWIPGMDFLPSAPTNVKSPANWTSSITHLGSADGYAIQWTASNASAYLGAGQTLSGFGFDSTIAPAQLAGSAGGTPIETSFVYIGAPLGDAGFSFVPTNTAATVPAAGGVTPAFGSGNTSMLTFSFSDSGGYQNLKLVDILINNVLDGKQACYIAFIPSGATTGTVNLVDDAGDAGGPFATVSLPGSAMASNSQCSVNGTGAVVSGTGNTLSLTLPITFTPSFAGNKVVYVAAANALSNSGWSPLGTWNTTSGSVSGLSVALQPPGRGTTATATYTFQFNDTKGYQDLAIGNILVNNAINAGGACYIAFLPTSATSGTALLVDNAGDAGGPFAGVLPLPGGSSITNGQCTVNGAGSSVTSSGNTITVALNITFNHSFAGNQILFGAARSATQNSGWQSVGTVGVP
jgi:hypothetical protein